MNNAIPIQSINCGPLGTTSNILIDIVQMNIMSDNCTVQVRFLTEGYSTIGATQLKMTGVTYSNWGQDNTYVKNWVFDELNLQNPS